MTDQFGPNIINLCVAYMDVGNEREHAYRDVGGRAMQEQLPRGAVALLAFRALIFIILIPNLIRPDLCRGSLIILR